MGEMAAWADFNLIHICSGGWRSGRLAGCGSLEPDAEEQENTSGSCSTSSKTLGQRESPQGLADLPVLAKPIPKQHNDLLTVD